MAAWIVLKGDLSHLEPVRDAVNGLVHVIQEKLGDPSDASRDRLSSAVLFIALSAFGEALIGTPLRNMLDQDEAASRRVVAGLLPYFVARSERAN